MNLDMAPNNPSTWETLISTIVWLMVWFMIAMLVFMVLILIGSMFVVALKNSAADTDSTVNPLLWFILMIIAFFGSFMWSMMVTGLYSLFFSNKYYDFGKMFKAVLISNIIIFFSFAPLYVVFYNKMEMLFVLLAFHMMFAVFMWSSAIEFITNPNYSTVHIMGTTLWFVMCILIFWMIYKSMDLSSWNSTMLTILLSMPSILSYTLIPLCHSLWEKMYYKFYEVGNNFFYIPSINEIMVDEEEEEESVNVE